MINFLENTFNCKTSKTHNSSKNKTACLKNISLNST